MCVTLSLTYWIEHFCPDGFLSSWASMPVFCLRCHLCACVRLRALAQLSWLDLCFNEAAEARARYYSRAQHYSWPISLRLLLWELLDSFPILWSCIACECACQSLFTHAGWYSCVKLYWARLFFFFPLKRKRLIPECVINPIFTPSSHLRQALTGRAYCQHYPTRANVTPRRTRTDTA